MFSHDQDPQQTDKVTASLIDQATAAAAAGRFEEARLLEQAAYQAAYQAARAGVKPNGAPSPQVETALAQALPPSESATAADRPEAVGKTDKPILFPKLASQLQAGPSPLVEAPRDTPPVPPAPGRVAALQRTIELPPASGSAAGALGSAGETVPRARSSGGRDCMATTRHIRECAKMGSRTAQMRAAPPMAFGSNGRNIAQAARSGTLCSRSRPASRKSSYLKTYLPPFGRSSKRDKFYHSEIKGKRHWFRLASKMKPSAPELTYR